MCLGIYSVWLWVILATNEPKARVQRACTGGRKRIMDSLYGHTWCNCLECDLNVEAISILVVEHQNRDPDLGMALVHFAHTNDASVSDTSYSVFGEIYLICNRFGNILDPMYYDDDDDDPWEPEDLYESRIL